MYTWSKIPLTSERSPFLVRALAATAALFALFGIGAREAHAGVSTELVVYNNTGVALSNPVVSNWGNQGWSACFDGSSPNGPPAVIPKGATVCLGTSSSGFGTNGTGGTITYTMDLAQLYDQNGNAIQMPTDTVAFTWSTPWSSVPPINTGLWSCSSALSSCYGTAPFATCTGGDTADTFNVSFPSNGHDFTCVRDDAGNFVEWEVNTVLKAHTLWRAGFRVPTALPFRSREPI